MLPEDIRKMLEVMRTVGCCNIRWDYIELEGADVTVFKYESITWLNPKIVMILSTSNQRLLGLMI